MAAKPWGCVARCVLFLHPRHRALIAIECGNGIQTYRVLVCALLLVMAPTNRCAALFIMAPPFSGGHYKHVEGKKYDFVFVGGGKKTAAASACAVFFSQLKYPHSDSSSHHIAIQLLFA